MYKFSFFILLAIGLLSCQDNSEQLEKISALQEQLNQMQARVDSLGEEEAEESKTELDASGIAIVDMGRLLDEYKGWQEASKKWERQKNSWDSQLKKMQEDFYKEYEIAANEAKLYGEEFAQKRIAGLQKKEQEIIKKEQDFSTRAQTYYDDIMKKNLDKINAHSKKYAQENGYKMILFTAVENGIFYAEDEINITQEYIEDINAAYEAKN